MKFKTVYYFLFLITTFFFVSDTYSQDTSLVFGNKIIKQKLNYYDFSDPLKINFEVIVWGGFKNPGKYIVPEGTTLIDLLTFAGMPPASELLEDVKLIRAKDITSKYSTASVLKFNFEKFFNRETTNYDIDNPLLRPGDILLTPTEVERGFWDYFKEGLVILGPIASILSLIVTLSK
jgi:hypothetical protein